MCKAGCSPFPRNGALVAIGRRQLIRRGTAGLSHRFSWLGPEDAARS